MSSEDSKETAQHAEEVKLGAENRTPENDGEKTDNGEDDNDSNESLQFEDFRPSTIIYVRGERKICYALDFPLVYFAGSEFEIAEGEGEKRVEELLAKIKILHRSFVADPELFTIGPDFGKTVRILPLGSSNGLVGGQHLGMPAQSNAAKSAANSLLGGQFFGGSSSLGGSLAEFGIDDDDDDLDLEDEDLGFSFGLATTLDEDIETLDEVDMDAEDDEVNGAGEEMLPPPPQDDEADTESTDETDEALPPPPPAE